MRVIRANLDGSQLETLVGCGDKDQRDRTRWCVGITIDPKLRKIYWTQKGADNGCQGRILRANIGIPDGANPTNRCDIEVLFDRLPNRSISNSIWRTVSSIGEIAAILRAATPSIARQSIKRPCRRS